MSNTQKANLRVNDDGQLLCIFPIEFWSQVKEVFETLNCNPKNEFKLQEVVHREKKIISENPLSDISFGHFLLVTLSELLFFANNSIIIFLDHFNDRVLKKQDAAKEDGWESCTFSNPLEFQAKYLNSTSVLKVIRAYEIRTF